MLGWFQLAVLKLVSESIIMEALRALVATEEDALLALRGLRNPTSSSFSQV